MWRSASQLGKLPQQDAIENPCLSALIGGSNSLSSTKHQKRNAPCHPKTTGDTPNRNATCANDLDISVKSLPPAPIYGTTTSRQNFFPAPTGKV